MQILQRIGSGVLSLLENVGSFSMFSWETFRRLFTKPFDVKSLVFQMNEIGIKSLPVGLVSSFFIGMVMALQLGGPLERNLSGITSFMGGGIALAMIRELAPVITSVLLAGRVGSAMAAEVGTMRVTEQIDALTTLATNPIHYLSVPRFLASITTVPLVVTLAVIVGTLGGMIISEIMFDIPYSLYIETARRYVDPQDVISGVSKSFFFGAEISLVSVYTGFNASGGARGVGNATISAVVLSIMMIIVSDYFLTYIFTLFGL